MHSSHDRWGSPHHVFTWFFGRHRHGGGERHGHGSKHHGGGRGGPFGGRRPLRFLARRLGLSEEQFDVVHRAVSDLRTEHAQAAVDLRRAAGSLGDAVAGEAFDADKAKQGADERTRSAERLNAEIVEALRKIHAVLDAEQRAVFALMIREMPPWLL